MPVLPLVGFLSVTGLLYLLPFLPALVEWRRRGDATPLPIIRTDLGDTGHFARRFRAYLQSQMPGPELWKDGATEATEATGRPDEAVPAPRRPVASSRPVAPNSLASGVWRLASGSGARGFVYGKLRDGTPYQWIGGASRRRLTLEDLEDGGAQQITLAACPLVLPNGARFPIELYAIEALEGGERCLYRAVLGEREIRLGPESVVLRWLHGESSVAVDRDSALYGRVSAERSLRLARGCRFERLQAPCIGFDAAPEGLATEDTENTERDLTRGGSARVPLISGGIPHSMVSVSSVSSVADPHTPVRDTRWLARGDLEIPPGSMLRCDVVVTGRLRIGGGSQIVGSLKSHQEMAIGDAVCVEGSLVSSGCLRLGAGCRIRGPVIAEQEIVIETGCQLGSPASPTTVTAPHIRIAPGVLAFGTVWARQAGHVLP